MPIPVIVWVGGAIIAAAVAGAAMWFKWDKIVIFFKGKRVAILGESAVGKTTMHEFLRNGVIPEEHLGTVRDKKKPNRFSLRDLNLDLKEGTDIGGLDDFLSEWKEIFMESDFCLYLFNSEKVFNSDMAYIEKVERHLTHINKWKVEKKGKGETYLVGTFADKIDEFKNYDGGDYQNFESKFRAKLSDAILQGNIKSSAVVVGSLDGDENRSNLVARLLQQVSGT